MRIAGFKRLVPMAGTAIAWACIVAAVGVACSGDSTKHDITPIIEDTLPPDELPTPTSQVAYEVVDRADVSMGDVVRIVYRVSVSGPLTEQDLRTISQEIIVQETDARDVNAIEFLYYLPGTDTAGTYTAGKADWAPDGDWSKADSVQAGDYSRHQLGGIDLGGP